LHKTDTFIYNSNSVVPDSGNAWTFDAGLGAMRQTNWDKFIKNTANQIIETRQYHSTYPNGNNPYLQSKNYYTYEPSVPQAIISIGEANRKYNIFPNPSKGTFSVNNSEEYLSCSLFNLSGQPIPIQSISKNVFKILHPLSGIYVLRIEGSDHKIYTQQLNIIQ
jgi:hypothetical protein